MKRIVLLSLPLAAFAAGALAVIGWLGSQAPHGAAVKLLGGLVPGRVILAGVLAAVAMKVWRVWTWSPGLSRQTGGQSYAVALASLRSALEGALLAALVLGSLNPAVRPAPLLILDLPAWDKSNWHNAAEATLQKCLLLAQAHGATGVQVRRAAGETLLPDTDFQKALDQRPLNPAEPPSAACRDLWNTAFQRAYVEAAAGAGEREIYHALRLIQRDLRGATPRGLRRLDLADGQVLYIVSLGKATAKRTTDPQDGENYYPPPAIRRFACYWRSINPQAGGDEASEVGAFWTQAPYYYPRLVYTYQIPVGGSLPTIQLHRTSVRGSNTVDILPTPNGIVNGENGQAAFYHTTRRVGSNVSLAVEGPGLLEDFGALRPFPDLALSWEFQNPVTGKRSPFHPEYKLDERRRMVVCDSTGLSGADPQIAAGFKFIAPPSGPTVDESDVHWVTALPQGSSVTKPTIVIRQAPRVGDTKDLPFYQLRAPLTDGQLRPEFQRGWRAFGTPPAPGTAALYYLEGEKQKETVNGREVIRQEIRPIAWFLQAPTPGHPAIIELEWPAAGDAWMTGNHHQALLNMTQSLTTAAADGALRLPGPKATSRRWHGDEGQTVYEDLTPPPEADQPLWRLVASALWPNRESDDFYIPGGVSSLRPICLNIALFSLTVIFAVWLLALLSHRSSSYASQL